ncbi:MAG: helix-turn-helix domain-containing protein [Dehalococcoidia bacterium]
MRDQLQPSNSYEQYRDAEHEHDSATKDAYERLGPRFDAIRELLRARRAAGLTQAELARAMRTTRSVVSRMESGRHSPSVDTLASAASALGCRLSIRFIPAEVADNSGSPGGCAELP